MTTDLDIRGVVIPAAELSWRFSRSSGPGGQSVNTTDSRAEVSFDLGASTVLPDVLKERALRRLEGRLVDGVLTVASSEQRSQLMNRQSAVRRLIDILVEATAPPPPPRRPTKPSRGMRERRLRNKHHRGEIKRLRRSTGD
ncbi:alternative ribosome rescue aminoacyl-tRNA hydrolase ArfB [Embleya scabrispora]|jgi:ribosome-associated protein|uniref:alternative ribosome rescue aminoacyl-tRNA hydrolase ArfB n=1 Tax=Embleya scabrispora TaxID=159449 RepID=UPI00037582D2|nr:alternative ribosome rescue aminoacyl-tRNA hydrolase ArfB [Embleya scabrispora]MYS84329.1 aminoacyl-tRNA hydrolase [Streptomyces sp. SID5474]